MPVSVREWANTLEVVGMVAARGRSGAVRSAPARPPGAGARRGCRPPTRPPAAPGLWRGRTARGDLGEGGPGRGGVPWPWLVVMALVVVAAVVGLGLVATDPAFVEPGPGSAVFGTP